MADYIIFDLDGTVACSRHRSHHLIGRDHGGEVDWDAWDADTLKDGDIEPVQQVLRSLRIPCALQGVRFLFLTARGERARGLTEHWMRDRDLYRPEQGDELVMRAADDTRPDTEIKREFLQTRMAQGHRFLFAFEDRRLVAEMLRELGIFVFHVADYD